MAVSGQRAGQGFSSTVFLASDEDFQVYCEPCDRDGPRLSAYGYCTDCKEHLCESCFNHHRRATLSRHHSLLDKDSMPQTQQLSSAHTSAGQSGEFIEPCAKHKKELIKFYCHDHEALLCSVCVTLEHTVYSCKVNYIPDISGDTIDSQEYNDTLKELERATEKMQNTTEKNKKMIGKSNSSLKDVFEDIKMFRKEIKETMDKLEKQAEDAASGIRQANDKSLKTIETHSDEITKSLKASADSVKQQNTSRQAERLFVELKKARETIKQQNESISQVSSSEDIKVYTFEPDKVISSLLETAKSLGTLSSNILQHSSLPASAVESKQPSNIGGAVFLNTRQTLQHGGRAVKSEQLEKQGKVAPTSSSESGDIVVEPRQPLHRGEIPVKTSQDKKQCWITGMILLTPNRLLVTDFLNYSVKVIDTFAHSTISQMKLNTGPWDISSVNNNEFAVTLPTEKTIQFISASANTVKKMHTLVVDGECRGISCYQDKMVVSFINPGKVIISDKTGNILTTIKPTFNGKDTFKVPNYVKTSSSSIYVSDRGDVSVKRLNWQGQVTGQYRDIVCPQGIAQPDDGYLYMCDNTPGKNVIHKISGNFTKERDTFKALISPFAVCVCKKENKLYFSCFTNKGDRHDDFIQVQNM